MPVFLMQLLPQPRLRLRLLRLLLSPMLLLLQSPMPLPLLSPMLLLLLLLLLLPSLLQHHTLPEASFMLRMSSATLTMAMPTSTLPNKKLETPTEVSAEDTLMLMPTELSSRFNTLLMEPASVLLILVFQLLLSTMVLPQPSTLSP